MSGLYQNRFSQSQMLDDHSKGLKTKILNIRLRESTVKTNLLFLVSENVSREKLGTVLFCSVSDFSQICHTRLLGRFAPIFYLNCEHVLFVYKIKNL